MMDANKKNSTIQIYCRLRPVDDHEQQKKNYKIKNSYNKSEKELIESDQSKVKNMILMVDKNTITLRNPFSLIEQKFLFDQVFKESCSQEKLFEEIGQPLLHEALLNQNDALLFAYGVTSSGKSYTINGTPEQPGIIPRSIAYIFNVLTSDRINRKNQILSDGQNGFVFNNLMDPKQPSQIDLEEEEFVEEFFFLDQMNRKNFPRILLEWSNAKILIDSNLLPKISNRKRYTIFLSFVEIYNNYIYDLLEIQNPQRMKWDRCPLQLIHDSNQMVYVQGAREIEVSNLDEAFKVFLFGLQNRRLAQTKMNDTSSRSHSVFNIKLVHFETDDSTRVDDHFIAKTLPLLKVNQFSIVDLAGLERANRTENTGSKLNEASNINQSLMALRQCFDALQKNMILKKKLLIPYRLSKLTYMLKRFFEFRSQICMIICLKPDVDDYDENVQVLNFGRNVQKITIENFQNYGDGNVDGNNSNDGDDDDCKENEECDILELNLQRFNAEHFKNAKTKSMMIEAIRDYLGNYEKNLNQIFSKAAIIIHKLDNLLREFPENQLDRKSLNLRTFKVNFSNLGRKLKSFHQQQKSMTLDNVANTPIVYHANNGIINDNVIGGDRSLSMDLILKEFRRELPVWENESIELENKFASIIASCHRYVDRSFVTSSVKYSQRKLPLKEMDVFNRLYLQSPARYKLNQSLNRSMRNKRNPGIGVASRGLMSSISKLIKNKNETNHPMKQQQLQNPSKTVCIKKDKTITSKLNLQIATVNDKNDSITPLSKTMVTKVKRTPMSNEIKNLCDKFESISAKNLMINNSGGKISAKKLQKQQQQPPTTTLHQQQKKIKYHPSDGDDDDYYNIVVQRKKITKRRLFLQ